MPLYIIGVNRRKKSIKNQPQGRDRYYPVHISIISSSIAGSEGGIRWGGRPRLSADDAGVLCAVRIASPGRINSWEREEVYRSLGSQSGLSSTFRRPSNFLWAATIGPRLCQLMREGAPPAKRHLGGGVGQSLRKNWKHLENTSFRSLLSVRLPLWSFTWWCPESCVHYTSLPVIRI